MWGYAKNAPAAGSRRGRGDRPVGARRRRWPAPSSSIRVIGVVKADIGIKDGRIAGIGRAGNPAISDGIDLRSAPTPSRSWATGSSSTPGAIDTHVHTISPALLPAALSAGVTTLITAGFEEPPCAMERTFAGARGLADQRRPAGRRAGIEDAGALDALLDAGACGFKIHEDYGAYPELIDHVLALRRGARRDRLRLHTDGLHESAELEDTIAAIAGRTVHAYHVEGRAAATCRTCSASCARPTILCSSTTPTLPFGVNAAAEHVPMIVLNHGLSCPLPGDVALVRERVHPGDDGRGGAAARARRDRDRELRLAGDGPDRETVRRTFQLAHVMKAWRATEAADGHPGPAGGPGPRRPR